jgi:hypothetical protein
MIIQPTALTTRKPPLDPAPINAACSSGGASAIIDAKAARQGKANWNTDSRTRFLRGRRPSYPVNCRHHRRLSRPQFPQMRKDVPSRSRPSTTLVGTCRSDGRLPAHKSHPSSSVAFRAGLSSATLRLTSQRISGAASAVLPRVFISFGRAACADPLACVRRETVHCLAVTSHSNCH